jgi:hypothetical protein
LSFSYIIIGFQCIYVCAIEISDYITIKFESIKRHGEKSVMDYPGPTLGVFFFYYNEYRRRKWKGREGDFFDVLLRVYGLILIIL